MIFYRICCLMTSLFCCTLVYAVSAWDKTSYWQCTIRDGANNQWTSKNSYQKSALTIAYDACKKQSKAPLTCKASISDCELFNKELSTKPSWRCTALDMNAQGWWGHSYAQGDDAALEAKANCRQKSAIPDTCYTNMVTCTSYNADFSPW